MAENEHRYTKGRPDEAFERLYRAHRREVYRFVLRDVGDPQEAEDVTQIAFLDAYRALARGNRPDEPRPWLFTIARNASRRRFRRPQPDEVPLEEAVPVVDSGAAEAAAREIVAAVLALSRRHREVLLLREVHGYSAAETAGELGTSIASVEMALFRARREVRGALERAGLGPERRTPLPLVAGLLPARLVRWLAAAPGVASAPAALSSFGIVGLGATLVVALGGASGAAPRPVTPPVERAVGVAPAVHAGRHAHPRHERSQLDELAGVPADHVPAFRPPDAQDAAVAASESAAAQQHSQTAPPTDPPAARPAAAPPAPTSAAPVAAVLPHVNVPAVEPPVAALPVPQLPAVSVPAAPAAVPAVLPANEP